MNQRFDGPLGDLLPIRFEGGFVLEVLGEDCDHCQREIRLPNWHAECSWLAPASCVIELRAQCQSCASEQTRRIRVRAQQQGWASVDWLVDGKWSTAVVGNVTWSDRVRQLLGLTS